MSCAGASPAARVTFRGCGASRCGHDRGIVTPNSFSPSPTHENHGQDRQSSSQDRRPKNGQGPVLGFGRRAAPYRRQGDARRQAHERGRGPLHGARYRGARRSGAGAPASGHVYRRHRREGAASPLRRGDRQFHGRGAGGARQLHRRRDGGRRLRRGDRQRPRHSRRSAPEVQEQVRARSDHVHLARGRQVRFESVRDLRRLARRRCFGRQRTVGAHGGGGRARADALPHGVRARQAQGQAGKGRPRAQPSRHQGSLPARSRHLRSEGAFQAGAHLQDGALQSLSVRRRRDPLVLRPGAPARRHGRSRPRRPSISPTGSRSICPPPSTATR